MDENSEQKEYVFSVVRFSIEDEITEFNITHNLPDVRGMSIEDAVVNWLFRTDDYSVESLCDYINDKDIGHVAFPSKE